MTRDEHLAWCKQRALEYVDAGDLANAVASMTSDLKEHPDTHNPALNGLALIGIMYVTKALRRFCLEPRGTGVGTSPATARWTVPRVTIMKTKPDFKFGDRVVFLGDREKRGVVRRVFQSGGLWWLAFEGEPDWRYSPAQFKRVA
jgi:hypothetical protein